MPEGASQPRPDHVYQGDCIEMLRGWPAEWADLIFADPPYNIGYKYDVYHDKQPYEKYVNWTRDWMAACQRALKSTGSFYIAIGDEYAAEVRLLGRDLGLHLRNWIIWHYSFGQNNRKKFCRSHTHIFYFVADPKQATFNDKQVRYPSARHTIYRDRRGHPLGRLPDDTWDEFPRVCGTFRERAGFCSCQMPEALLARVIRVSSNPGDLVLDPFAGSGTTLAAAVKLGRHFVGIDISAEYVKQCRARVRQAKALRARSLRCEQADGPAWPPLEEEALIQLYRDTQVPAEALKANPAAMECFLRCLGERTNRKRSAEEVTAKLQQLAAAAALPPVAKMRPAAGSQTRRKKPQDPARSEQTDFLRE